MKALTLKDTHVIWRQVKYSRLKSRACNYPEVRTPQGLLP